MINLVKFYFSSSSWNRTRASRIAGTLPLSYILSLSETRPCYINQICLEFVILLS